MDSIRDPAELRQALQFIYNTEAQQLATVMRAGPGEGRSKLLLAITLSTDSALRFHYDSQAESSTDKGAGKGKDPVRRTDNSTSTDPVHSVHGDATGADPPKPVEVPPSTSSTTPSTSLPAESPAGSTSTPGTSGRPKLDLVDEPTPKVPLEAKTVPFSVRQLNCCRAACQQPGCQALCGYQSEVPYDSHFSQHSSVRHYCKEHFRSRSIASQQAEGKGSSEQWHSTSSWDQDWDWNNGYSSWHWK